jgi:hypothetical protein
VIIPYTSEYQGIWEDFVTSAPNATLLHTRRFLSYHGDRFKDRSLMVMDSDKLVGVLPAAEDRFDSTLVATHPGTTFGGLVHQGRLSGLRTLEVLRVVVEYYTLLGYKNFIYKALPYIYAAVPSQDDLYALFRLGAQRTRCDLSCAIDLENRQPPSQRRVRALKKASKSVCLSTDGGLLSDLWSVVAENLDRKHGAQPVHSLAELEVLMERFPREIKIVCALIDGRVEAGVVLFTSSKVWHAQYIAATEVAYDASALDMVFDSAISDAKNNGARFFDFGTSNEQGGTVLNEGLYRFKNEFGGGGIAHEYYNIRLLKGA